MDATYVSGLSALAGSAIGAFSSFVTTRLTQDSKFRTDRTDRENTRREVLYGAFIDEVSLLFADAIVHDIRDETQFVKLYSMVSRMRTFAPQKIVDEAEAAIQQLIATYSAPNRCLAELRSIPFGKMDPLRQFSEACREDLASI